jgi:hypothetical protein
MPIFRRRTSKPPPQKADPEAIHIFPKGVTRPQRAIHDAQSMEMVRRARIERALHLFLSTENWEATRTTLENEKQFLLTDEARSLLVEFIEQTRDSDAPGAERVASYLDAHLMLLDRAREVGIDRAWREFVSTRVVVETPPESPESTQEAETQSIVDSLRRLLAARTWSETREVLEREQRLLLTDTADEFLGALMRAASRYDSEEAQDSYDYLRLHRQLLRDARNRGIDPAWVTFQRDVRQHESEIERRLLSELNGASLTDVKRSVVALLNTPTWTETRRQLERDKALLLTGAGEFILRDIIRQAEREPTNARRLAYLQMHLRLIQLAREEGIDKAWLSFAGALDITDGIEIAPDPIQRVRNAVRTYLAAASWESAHTTLLRLREDLLGDLAISLISAQADQLEADPSGRNLYAARLLRLQEQLLRRARDVGIERAWGEFEADR